MPQASEQQRNLYRNYFPDMEPGDGEAFLKSQGYTIKGGWIKHPTKDHVETRKEAIVIDYLIWEWDYAFS